MIEKKGAQKGSKLTHLACQSHQAGLTDDGNYIAANAFVNQTATPINRLIQGIVLLLLAIATNSIAQRCGATCASPESFLGLSEQALVAYFPEIKRLPKPVPGPRNSRGKWALPEMLFAAQPFNFTFFINSGHVSRIELLSSASQLDCIQRIPFEHALAVIGTTYGESQAFGTFDQDGKSVQSVAFGNQAIDVSLQYSTSPDACATRVIYKKREVKDASEL
jgi:hypothetical protein